MKGYKWDPVMRVVPNNGAPTVYWFSERLTDMGVHTTIGLRYSENMATREDINRTLRPVVYGLRPEVEINCVILSMADQQFLAEIESALLQPKRYAVFLSLDGGVVYRQVVLNTSLDMTPISGKTIIGATFRLSVKCADLLTERPNMMVAPPGGAELVHDGGMEQWTSPSVLQTWGTTPTFITLSQELGVVRSGTYSAKVLRTDGFTQAQLVTGTTLSYLTVERGHWYRFQAYARGTANIPAAGDGSGPFRASIYHAGNGQQIQSNGITGAATPDSLPVAAVTTTDWTLQELYFRYPTAWPSDNMKLFLRFNGYWTGGQALYYDDVSVFGPVQRPGVSTW